MLDTLWSCLAWHCFKFLQLQHQLHSWIHSYEKLESLRDYMLVITTIAAWFYHRYHSISAVTVWGCTLVLVNSWVLSCSVELWCSMGALYSYLMEVCDFVPRSIQGQYSWLIVVVPYSHLHGCHCKCLCSNMSGCTQASWHTTVQSW